MTTLNKTQLHHVFPRQLADHKIFDVLGYDIDDPSNLIRLPATLGSKGAHADALAAFEGNDGAHSGKHPAYTRLVEGHLDQLEKEFFDATGNLRQGKTLAELQKKVASLQYFYKDGLTAQIDADGKIQQPKIFVNNGDPRAKDANGKPLGDEEFFDEHFKKKGLDQLSNIENTDVFINGAKLNAAVKFNDPLPDTGKVRQTGLDTVLLKLKAAQDVGMTTYNGIGLSASQIDALKETALDLTSKGTGQTLSGTADPKTPGKLDAITGKLGDPKVAIAAVLATSVIAAVQVVGATDASASELLEQLDLDFAKNLAGDLATSVTQLAFETAVLTVATGGVGTAIRLGLEAADAVEIIQLTIEILDAVFPEWGLKDAIGQAAEVILDLVNVALQSAASAAGFKEFIIVDTTEATTSANGVLAVSGSGESDLIWARGDGEAEIDTGAGEDWIFHIGKGTVRAGDGDDFIYAENSVEPGDGQTYGQEREEMTVDAGAGDDWVISVGAAEIHLGAGQDVLFWAGTGSVIHTGPGGEADADSLGFIRGSLVTDADGYDELFVYGVLNAAGTYIRYAGSESDYAYGKAGLIKVGFNKDGELLVGDVFSSERDEESFVYFANGNRSPTAPTDQLTAGIRVGEIEIYVWQIMETAPSISKAAVQAMWDFMRATLKEFFDENYAGGTDPLVLDLDGDGLELTARVTGVGPKFDMDGDGFLEFTGWVRPDDGLLALDANGNGKIDDISELFGGARVSGFSELATHDTNKDGVINADDQVYSQLRVWRDLNQDGVTNDGELSTLSSLGIASIGLTATTDGRLNALNTVARTGTFTYADGRSGKVGDIEFQINNYDTTYAGDKSVNPIIAATLPNLKGHGTLTDLHVAMTLQGANGHLASTVAAVLPTLNVPDLETLRERAFDILEAWVDAPPPHAASAGNPDVPVLLLRAGGKLTVIDFAVQVTENVQQADGSIVSMTFWRRATGSEVQSKDGIIIKHPDLDDVLSQFTLANEGAWQIIPGSQLDFLERYIGEDIPVDNPNSLNNGAVQALGSLLETSERVLDQLALRLAIQGGLKPYFVGIEFVTEQDKFVATTPRELVPLFEAVFRAAPGDAEGAQEWLASWGTVLNAFLADYDRPGSSEVSYPFLFTNIVAAYENVGLSVSLQDAAGALGIPGGIVDFGTGTRTGSSTGQMFFMSTGDDVAKGQGGGDVYVIGKNFGNDVIDDFQQSGDSYDVIRFAHLNPEDIYATREGLDLILQVKGSSDAVRIKGQFHEMAYSAFGGNVLPTQGVDEIVFANRTVWTKGDIALAVSHPMDSDDQLTGTDHTDYLDGGLGNDVMSGGDGTDFYIFGSGYGHDVVDDNLDNILSRNEDVILFKEGFDYSKMVVSRTGYSHDVTISFGTADKLEIRGQFRAAYTGVFGTRWFDRIEHFEFKDPNGSLNFFNHNQLMDLSIKQSQTDGDDFVYGFSREDVLDGGKGNDLLSGGNDNDTYIFGLGYGHDRIRENVFDYNVMSEQVDKVVFTSGVRPDQVRVARFEKDNALVITLLDGSTLTIEDQFFANNFGNRLWQIETFEFADGTVWTVEDVQLKLLQSTGQDDRLFGTFYNDVIDGGPGNDYLNGGDGNDTYVFGLGYGNDVVFDDMVSIFSNEADRVVFKAGVLSKDVVWSRPAGSDDLVATLSDGSSLKIEKQFVSSNISGSRLWGIETFEFADGSVLVPDDIQKILLRATDQDDHLRGFFSRDILDGGAGNDRLEGGDHGDIYRFGLGYGQDVIYDFQVSIFADAPDRIEFNSGIAVSDLTVQRGGEYGYDLYLKLNSSDVLKVEDYFKTEYHRIEEIVFADGTVWNYEHVLGLLNVISGTIGDDVLDGFNAAETLIGGKGNDVLNGKHGNDTYIYERGDGNDTIIEETNRGSDDRLVLRGVTSSGAAFARDGDHLLLEIANSSGGLTDGGIIKIERGLDEYHDQGIETIEFADGLRGCLKKRWVISTGYGSFGFARFDGVQNGLERNHPSVLCPADGTLCKRHDRSGMGTG
ncbi:calcium-binding protein [Pannonibacter sp. SL95]|uniref:calcium-binding protein n=1 Tax=Pannonibacter sp. SL95 TaxID=2995153 RepID=UPI002275C2F2|nr:calcium-binding protein [Pannonibacter sp. SL95]MCY1707285.1 AHH domain-containing protein [Pannonibacter sp. SL95]